MIECQFINVPVSFLVIVTVILSSFFLKVSLIICLFTVTRSFPIFVKLFSFLTYY
jgi:hypothetical protein